MSGEIIVMHPTENPTQEVPVGVSLVEDSDGFILHRKRANGDVSAINLTEEEFFGLQGAITFWARRILSQRHAPPTGFESIIVHPVTRARIFSNAMRDNILLTVAAPTGEQMTLELTPHVARTIAKQLPSLLSEMSGHKWQ